MLFPRINSAPGAQINTSTTFARMQPALWDRYRSRTRTNDIVEGGYFRFWDFDNWGDTAAATTLQDGWKLHTDTSCSIVQVTTENGGVIRPTTDTTDNNSIDAMEGGGVGSVAITSGGSAAVAFDCRVRFTQITNTYNQFYGLTANGSAADNGFFTDAGAAADRGCIGFQVLEAAGSSLEFVYKKSGQTIQTTSGLKTIAAATWYSLGFIFDPHETNPARRIIVYIDNQEVAYVSDTSIAAATFPSGVLLGAGWAIKNQTTAAKSNDLDCMARAMAA